MDTPGLIGTAPPRRRPGGVNLAASVIGKLSRLKWVSCDRIKARAYHFAQRADAEWQEAKSIRIRPETSGNYPRSAHFPEKAKDPTRLIGVALTISHCNTPNKGCGSRVTTVSGKKSTVATRVVPVPKGPWEAKQNRYVPIQQHVAVKAVELIHGVQLGLCVTFGIDSFARRSAPQTPRRLRPTPPSLCPEYRQLLNLLPGMDVLFSASALQSVLLTPKLSSTLKTWSSHLLLGPPLGRLQVGSGAVVISLITSWKWRWAPPYALNKGTGDLPSFLTVSEATT
ncbi:hypothetical protein Bbelb_229980 [Branchiostoma belcheri]|nr:hypothetical protein Bbelb_229980 [Branchiostoma belcheri]